MKRFCKRNLLATKESWTSCSDIDFSSLETGCCKNQYKKKRKLDVNLSSFVFTPIFDKRMLCKIFCPTPQMYVVLNEFLQKTKYSTVKTFNVRFKLRLLATSIFSPTCTCGRKQHNCEKSEAHGQRDVALVRHLGSTEGTLFVVLDFTCKTCT